MRQKALPRLSLNQYLRYSTPYFPCSSRSAACAWSTCTVVVPWRLCTSIYSGMSASGRTNCPQLPGRPTNYHAWVVCWKLVVEWRHGQLGSRSSAELDTYAISCAKAIFLRTIQIATKSPKATDIKGLDGSNPVRSRQPVWRLLVSPLRPPEIPEFMRNKRGDPPRFRGDSPQLIYIRCPVS
jgi:hypothetical protein